MVGWTEYWAGEGANTSPVVRPPPLKRICAFSRIECKIDTAAGKLRLTLYYDDAPLAAGDVENRRHPMAQGVLTHGRCSDAARVSAASGYVHGNN